MNPPSAGALFEAFAPGRVNLIGEHIDYHGLSVLPMALERGIRLHFTPRDDHRILLENADRAFAPLDFELGPGLRRGPPGDWGNYAKAAAALAWNHFGCRRGIEGRLESDLPSAAGLSSSSALVVALSLALLHVADRNIPFLELAEAAAEGERFVGTAGGGMDQAASLLGRQGHALRIDFRPLAVQAIAMPSDWSVLVAHSGVEAEKSGAAQEAYNLRRSETTRGLTEVARRLGRPGAAPRELLRSFASETLLDAASTLDEPRDAWVHHVLAEARRVDQAQAALAAGNLEAFGRELVASHRSLRDLYGVSHPRLDSLVETALAAGAAGARLTGAGFGGCMLAVCRTDEAEALLETLAAVSESSRDGVGMAPFEAMAGTGAFVGLG